MTLVIHKKKISRNWQISKKHIKKYKWSFSLLFSNCSISANGWANFDGNFTLQDTRYAISGKESFYWTTQHPFKSDIRGGKKSHINKNNFIYCTLVNFLLKDTILKSIFKQDSKIWDLSLLSLTKTIYKWEQNNVFF